MVQDNPESIADRPTGPAASRVFWGILAGATALGGVAACYYATLDLTLSHYDARAHLVVARRVIDSLTPGWRQFGAVWLPLPHLLNVLPSQWDWAFRSGAVGVAISVVVLAWGLAAFSRFLFTRTGSIAAAIASPAVVALNPNVLYLQGTPMTEPLLLGFSLLALAAVDAWLQRPGPRPAARAGWLLAALVMTRYEGWLVAAALVGAAAITSARRGRLVAPALWLYPAVAIAAFALLGGASTGQWFLSANFFVPDPTLLHRPQAVADKVLQGAIDLGGWPLLVVGGIGLTLTVFHSWRHPQALLPAALVCAAILPIVAFYGGHPYRVRYMVPLVLAAGALSGWTVAVLPRGLRPAAACALVAAALWTRPPFDPRAPMVVEAQWETPFRRAREVVTQDLHRLYDGTPILASMGSLGHYMQEASHVGFELRHFLHEGNGDLWAEALRNPRLSVRWVLVEEQAEGGDLLAARLRGDPAFLAGFRRISEGGGLVLYGREP